MTHDRRSRTVGSRQDLHHASAGRRAAVRSCPTSHSRVSAGRMRGAVGTVGHRQVVDPEDDLRQLPLRPRADPGARRRQAGRCRARASRGRSSRCAEDVIGYVTQFLRAVPRVAAIDVVADPLVSARRRARERARARGAICCSGSTCPTPLWDLPPATFSGGEQQRVNIARGFLPELPILLLDEPTASLDAANRAVVIDLIREKKAARHGHRRHRPRRRSSRRHRRHRRRYDAFHRQQHDERMDHLIETILPTPASCSPTA